MHCSITCVDFRSVRMKDLDSEITIIESESVDDYYDLINELSKASKDLVGEDIAVIVPFEIEEPNEKFKIPVYDAESVKGLEFEGIVVLMLYMIPEMKHAHHYRKVGKSNDDVQSQIRYGVMLGKKIKETHRWLTLRISISYSSM